MIKSVTIINDKNEQIQMILTNPETSEFAIESIDGLEPEKADISSNELVSSDGSTFTNARKQTKQITFDLIFCPNDYNIERVRHKCYSFFPVKKKIKMIFETDERNAWIEGVVESNTPSIFSEREGTQISVICMDPWFKNINEHKYTIVGVLDRFEFPFSNESLSENLTEISSDNYGDNINIVNIGESEVGLILEITFDSGCDELSFYNLTTNKNMIILGKPPAGTGRHQHQIEEGDTLIISTISGNKKIELYTKDGDRYQYTSALSKNENGRYDFPTLIEGLNVIGIETDGVVSKAFVKAQYLYGGI